MRKLDKRAISIIVTAIFLLSTLAMAIPFSAATIDDQGGIVFASDGTSMPEWVTDGPPGFSGLYCVKTVDGTDRHQVVVAYGGKLSTLVGLTASKSGNPVLDVGVKIYYDTAGIPPYLTLLLDTTGDGDVDTAVPKGFDVQEDGTAPAADAWDVLYANNIGAGYQVRDVDSDGVLISSTYTGLYDDEPHSAVTLAALDASTDWLISGDDPTVLYIGIGIVTSATPDYIDDICIGGITYPLETSLPPSGYFSIDSVSSYVVDYGDILTVTGSGVTAGSLVKVFWDYASGTYVHLLNTTEGNPDGTYDCEIKVPSDKVGEHYLWATEVASGDTVSLGPINMMPLLKLSPSSGLIGDDVTIKGYGFTDEANLTSITFRGIELSTDPEDVETDEDGYFTYTFEVPDTATPGTNVVRAEDWYAIADSVDFTLGASIILDPDEGPTGTCVDVDGRGWTPYDTITFTIEGGGTVQVVGDATVTVKYDGTFSAEIVIPDVASTGDYDISASETGAEGPGKDVFEVDGLPKIKISPGYGTPGATVDIEGYNFTQITDTKVYLDFGAMTELKTFKTDSKGEFSGKFQVQAVDFIDYDITVYDAYGLEDTETFRVGMMVVIVSPNSGPSGDWIYLSGTGFSDNEDWNASIAGKLVASGNVDNNGLISDHFYIPTLDPGTYTLAVMDIDTKIELTTIILVTDTTRVTLDPAVAPNKYNMTINGYNFADILNGDLDFVIYNSTHDWDMDVNTHSGTHTTTVTDEDGNFTGHWHVPEKDVISIGDYTINITDSEKLFAQVPFSVVAARVSVEPRKSLFDRGDAIQFDVNNDFDFKQSYMRIWDPDDNLYWETGLFDTWLKVGTLYTVPYYLQTSGGNLMELAQDAPMGEWFWIFYETGTTQLVNGTFDVGPSTTAQIDAMLEDVMSDLAGLADDVAGIPDDFEDALDALSDDFADDMATLSADFADDIAGLSDEIADATAAGNAASDAITDLEGSMSDLEDSMGDIADASNSALDAAQLAADAAADAASAAEETQGQTQGITTLVYGAIFASLIAALAAIVSLMQISRRIAG